MAEVVGLNLHEDASLFREAVNFTTSRTGFNPRLIEKDYFCTVLLAYLARFGGDQPVFKGGTCLAKVHTGFHRLSEDLDFTIPVSVDANRSQRRQAAAKIKRAVTGIADHVRVFTVVEPLVGTNNSTQYNGAVVYPSPTTGQMEKILIEVSVREPLLAPAGKAPARTILLDPIGGEAMVSVLLVTCIAMEEAVAEKFRAALSRRDVAIRDFYDLDHAARRLGSDLGHPEMVSLVRRKLAVPGNLPVDVSPQRFVALKRQLDARLKPVLREMDYQAFDLDRAIAMVAAMAQRIA